jgi:hypothetical protein
MPCQRKDFQRALVAASNCASTRGLPSAPNRRLTTMRQTGGLNGCVQPRTALYDVPKQAAAITAMRGVNWNKLTTIGVVPNSTSSGERKLAVIRLCRKIQVL